jgi:UDP-N-acetylglucosamine--N-acetylmuramyl-(pentapeptide) pyrophosphoryl-undecaprenol N-acetylglucosamine transferase
LTAPLILIATGGTAGHVVPALAVADALRANGAEVAFVGGDRAEAELIPAAGYELHQLKVTSLPRNSPLGAAKAVAVDTVALASAVALLTRLRPRAVFGGGGYVSGPVGLAAAMLRVPLVIAEIDGHLGLTNRMLAPLARRVCTALPIATGGGSKFVITGRPIPPLPADRGAARARFGIAADEKLVLVFGGSLGARSINHAAVAAFAGPGFRVLHAAGDRDLPQLSPPRDGYDLRGYISGFMEAIVACDLAVARSGGSIWELAAAGTPSILIPYPHATADHQSTNARYLADAGAAIIIPDDELTAERLRCEVDALLAHPRRLEAMGRAALGLARPHAAAVIASEVLAAAGLGGRVAPGEHAGELEPPRSDHDQDER